MALKEVAIAARPNQSGSCEPGDIIVIREPVGYIGRKEGASYLWLLIDDSELPSPEETRKDGMTRAHIDLDDLKAAHPSLDLDRVRSDQDYQPFINPRRDTGKFQANVVLRGVPVRARNNSNNPVHQQRLIDAIRNR